MTTISWTIRPDGSTGATWNPFRAKNKATGGKGHFCIKVSTGCKNCYAEPFQPRYHNHIRYAAQDLQYVDLYLDEVALRAPLSMRRGRNIFPCSMTDLFATFYKEEWIDAVVAVAALTPRHNYLCLTKRAEEMRAYWIAPWRANSILREMKKLLPEKEAEVALPPTLPLSNWWQGVSVEDKENTARLEHIRRAHVAVRWVSAEPLLEDIADEIEPYLSGDNHLDWVVPGGESGHRARGYDVNWPRRLIALCRQYGVPLFHKQLGRKPTSDHRTRPADEKPHAHMFLNNRKGEDPSEWAEDLRVREYPR